jgi:alkylation response protein AidB-like acyl-CoA dehydrogenase
MTHGSQEVRDMFVRRLVTGEWMGTMCLTEPQCGSDLNQVKCRADKLEDGRYHINGTKIFISCGDHDITPNIVHLVLARVPGGPRGTHGLSLFAVPKHLVSESNEPDYSNFNGVNIGRIEVCFLSLGLT